MENLPKAMDPSIIDSWPAVELRFNRDRREINLIIRRPFYMNLRLGLTQNALWVGRNIRSNFHTVFNRFPIFRNGHRTV